MLRRVSEEPLMMFLKLHEDDIAKAGKMNPEDEWSLLWMAFWDMLGYQPGTRKERQK